MSFTFERSLDPSYYIVQLLPLTSCILECKFKAIGRRGFAITTTYDKGEGSRLDGVCRKAVILGGNSIRRRLKMRVL